MSSSLAEVHKSPKTVFSMSDLGLIWREQNGANLKARIAYYVKKGELRRLSRGIFAKEHFDPRELATSIYTPSYISFETILRDAGIIFQHYDTIFAAGRRSGTRVVAEQSVTFRKLKDHVLMNPLGIHHGTTHSSATPERAFLDMLYLFPQYYFDNLSPLNWEMCFTLAPLYHNTHLTARLHAYHEDYVT